MIIYIHNENRKDVIMANLEKLLKGMTMSEKLGQLAQYNASLLLATDADITGPDVKLGIAKEDLPKVGSILNFRQVEKAIEILLCFPTTYLSKARFSSYTSK